MSMLDQPRQGDGARHGDPVDGHSMRRAPSPVGPGQPASPLENALTLFGGIWLVAGLFVDGYAHSEILDTETEDFFTPWHAIFYSGFLFVSAVIGWVWARRAGASPPLSWLPPGYGWSVVGLVVFAAGGVGDGIWHTLLGVETGIDALLSPTHLLLFVGMGLILTTPLRAFWADPDRRATWGDAGGAVASTAIVTALTAFFFVYAFGIGETWTHRVPFDPVTEANENIVALGLSMAYVSTVILVVPLLLLLRRTDLPPGAAVLIWLVPVVATIYAFDGQTVAIRAALVGAVVLELVLRRLRRPLGRRWATISAVGIGTVALWSTWMALTHRSQGIEWMPELWAGQIVMCGVLATVLALLAFPSPGPVATAPERAASTTSS